MEGQENLPPTLRGTEVHVYKAGRLYMKTSFLGPKRPCTVEIRGRKLSLCQGEQRKTKQYDLAHAMLHKYTNLRLVLHLASKEKLVLYATDASECTEWIHALTDSIEWKIQRFYDIGRKLGQGAHATVRKGRHRDTGDTVAVKIISKSDCSLEDLKYLQREIDIAKCLKHNNVVRTSDIFESDNHLYIVLELMLGGTLQRLVDMHGPLREDDARYVMLDIFSAIQYLHQRGIVHRDIKPENMLCTEECPPMAVKIMDFGLSRLVQGTSKPCESFGDDPSLGPDGLMTTPVGTPNFVAPEILKSLPYGREVDMFACGVVMYWLLCGFLPFWHEDPHEMMELIKRVDYEFPEREWHAISQPAKDLITGLLDGSPYARTSADDALAHDWVTEIQRSGIRRKNTAKADETDELLVTTVGTPPEITSLQNTLDRYGSMGEAGGSNKVHNLTAVHSLSF